MDRKTPNVSRARRSKETMKSIFNARMWSLAHVYIIEHLRFILQIISIAPVFMDLVYSLPGWMLRTSEQPGLCRIICLKVKYRDVTAFRKERKKVD